MSTGQYGIIILAAGASTRLGTPKQLLPYRQKNLLRFTIEQAIESQAGPVIVVLGAHANQLSANIGDYKVNIIQNTGWDEGMASSIRCGIESLQLFEPTCAGAILLMCDQPFVNASLIRELVAASKETHKPVVTCRYANTIGPPALFSKSVFPELLELTGDTGARRIVEGHLGEVATVSFPKGNVDIDTIADYDELNRT
jgi:molybdenum cofactor cytidylyltransferase